MRFGLLYENTVVEVITPEAGKTIDDCVSAERVSDYVAIPDHVTAGYELHPNGTWIAPVDPVS